MKEHKAFVTRFDDQEKCKQYKLIDGSSQNLWVKEKHANTKYHWVKKSQFAYYSLQTGASIQRPKRYWPTTRVYICII